MELLFLDPLYYKPEKDK